jgi:hypothetical protein
MGVGGQAASEQRTDRRGSGQKRERATRQLARLSRVDPQTSISFEKRRPAKSGRAGQCTRPRVFYMHFWANDDPVKFATGLRSALDQTDSASAQLPEHKR